MVDLREADQSINTGGGFVPLSTPEQVNAALAICALLASTRGQRRKDVDQFPEWVPQTKEHRADGYSRIVGEKKPWTLAYEVELSAKNVQKYEGTLRFYKGAKGVDRILWLVATPFIRDQILRAKACIRDE